MYLQMHATNNFYIPCIVLVVGDMGMNKSKFPALRELTFYSCFIPFDQWHRNPMHACSTDDYVSPLLTSFFHSYKFWGKHHCASFLCTYEYFSRTYIYS